MSAGRLLFAVATTADILIALQFEERDLERYYGEQYRTDRRSPGLLLPLSRLKKLGQTPARPDADQFPIR
jgi:methanethiol S-methyltransferase